MKVFDTAIAVPQGAPPCPPRGAPLRRGAPRASPPGAAHGKAFQYSIFNIQYSIFNIQYSISAKAACRCPTLYCSPRPTPRRTIHQEGGSAKHFGSPPPGPLLLGGSAKHFGSRPPGPLLLALNFYCSPRPFTALPGPRPQCSLFNI